MMNPSGNSTNLNSIHHTMKPFTQSLTAFSVFTGLGLALFNIDPIWARRPELRLNAPTEDGRITQIITQLLEQDQFAHRRLDDTLAAKFLDHYLDSIDSSHEIFLQSDVAEFQRYLPRLAEATRDKGDTAPAHAIFDRYLQRIGERAAFVKKSLAEEPFDFTGHDRFSYDRKNAPRPRDEAEAHDLWRQRLRAEVLQEKLVGKKSEETARTLARRYERQAQTMKNFSDGAVLELYLTALANVYDPHSDYMGREQLESFNIGMNLSLVGVGATLEADDGMCRIRELVPGGPAATSGKLKVGDRIVAVSQAGSHEAVDIVDLPLPQAVDLIRGPKGTDVTLTVIPAADREDARKLVTIRRDEIKLNEQKAKARLVEFPVDGGGKLRLGVINLPAFYASNEGEGQSATADVERLIRKLDEENVQGLILDLRNNGGGSLDEAINLTGLFIPSGPVVQTRDLSGRVQVGADRDGKTCYAGPLVVLTSRFSASASEILAGALQDYGRALIVGDTSTFGKGTVQTVLPLGSIMEQNGIVPTSDPGALKLTISKFYRPGGNSTQLRGVRPDMVLPSFTDTSEISEAGMNDPLPWDAVPAAPFPDYHLVKPFAAALSRQSKERIASDRDFAWWLEDLAQVKENRTTKSVSLNEAERRKERDAINARSKARHAERIARHTALPTTYEITVKRAGEPGLPQPLNAPKPVAENAPAPNDEEAGDTAPAEDLLLRETQHILADYVNLLAPVSSPRITES